MPAVAAIVLPSLPAFAAGRPAAEVDAALRQALGVCDRARECAVLWFAEVQRRSLYRALGFASLQLYATQALGFSDNRYWQFKRLADDLDRLPALQSAVAAGEVGWTKAQQVARVATPATQAAWVGRAKAVGRRELERDVRAARAAARPTHGAQVAQLSLAAGSGAGQAGCAGHAGAPVAGGCLAPDAAAADRPAAGSPAAITLRADALQVARFEALVEKARKLGAVARGADRLEVVLAGLEALVGDVAPPLEGDVATSRAQPRAAARAPRSAAAAPAFQIVVQECPACAAAATVTARGDLPLVPAQAERARCDARVREGERPNRATIPPKVRAAVLARDRHRCATPGCGATRFLEVHHLVSRSAGGSNRAGNLVTLCARCHGFAHEQAARLRTAGAVDFAGSGAAPRRSAPPPG